MKSIVVMVPVTIDCNCAEDNVPPKKILTRMAANAIAYQLRLRVSAGAAFDAERALTYSVALQIHDARH